MASHNDRDNKLKEDSHVKNNQDLTENNEEQVVPGVESTANGIGKDLGNNLHDGEHKVADEESWFIRKKDRS